MPKTYSIHEAKKHLSRLIERACAGEEVVIVRGKVPVVRLSPVKIEPPTRRFGAMKGHARVTKAFFESLSEEELAAWEK